MKNTTKKTVRPIRLFRLEPGSTCTIFAEPSRGIFKSKDKTVYRRDTENTVLIDVNDESHCAILFPEDLVVPMSRPRRTGGK